VNLKILILYYLYKGVSKSFWTEFITT